MNVHVLTPILLFFAAVLIVISVIYGILCLINRYKQKEPEIPHHDESSRDVLILNEEVEQFTNTLKKWKNWYISYKQYDRLRIDYQNTALQIASLPEHVRKKDEPLLDTFLHVYQNLPRYISRLNQEYIQRELTKNKSFFDSIRGKSLDLQQRLVCITDDDYMLVVAGAGSGKTVTVEAKV